jgi:hypothetical protein
MKIHPLFIAYSINGHLLTTSYPLSTVTQETYCHSLMLTLGSSTDKDDVNHPGHCGSREKLTYTHTHTHTHTIAIKSPTAKHRVSYVTLRTQRGAPNPSDCEKGGENGL